MACPGVVPIVGRSLAEIDVFNTESEGFHDPQTGSIHELAGKFPRVLQTGDDGADFFASHDDGRAALATGGSEVIEGEVLDPKDVFDEEDHGIERLVLGGRGDVAFEGEELEVSRDGGGAGIKGGLAEFLETEADEAEIPVNVGFLGGDGAALEADGTTEGVNEFGEFRFGILGARRSLHGLERGRSSHLDGFTGEGAVVRFQGASLVDEGLPGD